MRGLESVDGEEFDRGARLGRWRMSLAGGCSLCFPPQVPKLDEMGQYGDRYKKGESQENKLILL